jgi:hypothetical protein
MKTGEIYVALASRHQLQGAKEMPLCEVVSLYYKPVFPDPDCPESIEIVNFVKYVYLTGDQQGLERTSRRTSFSRLWAKVSEQE